MSDHNNHLFHWMGPKKVLWIHERDLKNYPDPSQVSVEAGNSFLVQHAIHGCWSKGTYYESSNYGCLMIRWQSVIVIRENHQ